jgi:hypothetical protein
MSTKYVEVLSPGAVKRVRDGEGSWHPAVQIHHLNIWIFAINSLMYKENRFITCAADFSLLNLAKGKSLGRSKPATSSYAQAPQHTVWDDSYYIQALLNCLL